MVSVGSGGGNAQRYGLPGGGGGFGRRCVTRYALLKTFEWWVSFERVGVWNDGIGTIHPNAVTLVRVLGECILGEIVRNQNQQVKVQDCGWEGAVDSTFENTTHICTRKKHNSTNSFFGI